MPMHKKLKSVLEKVGFHIEEEPNMLFDVVCGMEFPVANAKYQSAHRGDAYYFCSESCNSHFDGDPEKYAGT